MTDTRSNIQPRASVFEQKEEILNKKKLIINLLLKYCLRKIFVCFVVVLFM